MAFKSVEAGLDYIREELIKGGYNAEFILDGFKDKYERHVRRIFMAHTPFIRSNDRSNLDKCFDYVEDVITTCKNIIKYEVFQLATAFDTSSVDRRTASMSLREYGTRRMIDMVRIFNFECVYTKYQFFSLDIYFETDDYLVKQEVDTGFSAEFLYVYRYDKHPVRR